MPNDTSWLRVRCGPVTCARPSAWRTSGAASGGQTRREPVPAHDEVPGPVLQADHRVGLGRQPDQGLVLDELHVPAGRREQHGAVRLGAAQQLDRGPAFGCGSGFPLPCSLIASARSAAMLAITWGSWIETAVWWMK